MSTSSHPPIVPPPESFLPPTASSSQSPGSSQSSGRKRKRDESVTVSTRFTEATRNQLLSLYGRECWLCNANTRLDNCHVIGQKDRAFSLYRQSGLLPFDSLADIQNAVPLCPTCHREFDDTQCPGFIFFPSNLQFFIDFERQDFERRCRWAREGNESPARICPSAEQYYTGASELYERTILQNYFPRLANETSDMIGALQPRSWHGSPMAALMRTFLILGSPVIGGAIKQEQRTLLRELQDLYLRPNPIPQLADLPSLSASGLSTSITTTRTLESGAYSTRMQNNQLGCTEASRSEEESHTPRLANSAVDFETVSCRSVGRDGRQPKRLRCLSLDEENRWSWGPASTSEDKAVWLPRLMGRIIE